MMVLFASIRHLLYTCLPLDVNCYNESNETEGKEPMPIIDVRGLSLAKARYPYA